MPILTLQEAEARIVAMEARLTIEEGKSTSQASTIAAQATTIANLQAQVQDLLEGQADNARLTRIQNAITFLSVKLHMARTLKELGREEEALEHLDTASTLSDAIHAEALDQQGALH